MILQTNSAQPRCYVLKWIFFYVGMWVEYLSPLSHSENKPNKTFFGLSFWLWKLWLSSWVCAYKLHMFPYCLVYFLYKLVIASVSDLQHGKATQLWPFPIIDATHHIPTWCVVSFLATDFLTVATLCILTPISCVLIGFHKPIGLWPACVRALLLSSKCYSQPGVIQTRKSYISTSLFCFWSHFCPCAQRNVSAALLMQIKCGLCQCFSPSIWSLPRAAE